MRIYPKVFKTNTPTKLFIALDDPTESIFVRIQGSEHHLIKHENYRIDEFDRHPYLKTNKVNDKLFEMEVNFPYEQMYTLTITRNVNEEGSKRKIYALKEDLYELKAYKGDTHLHTSRSDGLQEPKDIATDYRSAGFDFIVVTDHHIYESSLETRDIISKLTNSFVVFPGEEIHNKHMGYFHIVNIGGNNSVNTIVLNKPDEVDKEVKEIIKTINPNEVIDAYDVAYRIWVANKIKEFDGVATMAHPYWYAYGEYAIQTKDLIYILKNNIYDAVEMTAGYADRYCNLTSILYEEMLKEGYCKDLAFVGCSDSHCSDPTSIYGSEFGTHYTILFAKNNSLQEVKKSIKNQMSVACSKLSDKFTNIYGKYRYSIYTQFLIDEYFNKHQELCKANGLALKTEDLKEIKRTQDLIDAYEKEFFGK